MPPASISQLSASFSVAVSAVLIKVGLIGDTCVLKIVGGIRSVTGVDFYIPKKIKKNDLFPSTPNINSLKGLEGVICKISQSIPVLQSTEACA